MKKIALFALSLAAFAGCSKQPAQGGAATSRVIPAAEISASIGYAFAGDTSYAEVNSAWLASFYDEFRSEVFRQGVTKWDTRFDCNHFAAYYCALAQTKFYLANFQSSTPAQSLAVGTYWYRPAGGATGHAIVVALTERGPVFIEPQTGKEVVLTDAERQSAWLKVF